MNTILLVALTISVVLATVANASAHRSETSAQLPAQLLDELQADIDYENTYQILSRARRSQSKSCGSRLMKFVVGVCGGICTAETGVDIATKCCSSQCSEDFIRTACCP